MLKFFMLWYVFDMDFFLKPVDNWTGYELKKFREYFKVSKVKMGEILDVVPERIWQLEKSGESLSPKMKRNLSKRFFCSNVKLKGGTNG